jgi:hypothetical protein
MPIVGWMMNNYKKATQNPMYMDLVVLTIGSTIGLQTWRTLFNNFAFDVDDRLPHSGRARSGHGPDIIDRRLAY